VVLSTNSWEDKKRTGQGAQPASLHLAKYFGVIVLLCQYCLALPASPESVERLARFWQSWTACCGSWNLGPSNQREELCCLQALFDLEATNAELKSDLRDLYITGAAEIDVSPSRKAIIIHVSAPIPAPWMNHYWNEWSH
jgi:Ribosomal protein S7e